LKISLPRLLYSAGFVIVVSLPGCSSNKQKAEIPAYIKIDSIGFQCPDEQGTNRQNITEAWVYINDNLQGVYDLPCEFPVLAYGNKNIKVRGAVKRNGFETTHIDYPFFTTYSGDVFLEALKTTTCKPILNYYDDAKVWVENFEDAGYSFSSASNSDTGIFLTNEPHEIFEGTGTGKIILSGNNQFARVQTTQNMKLPRLNPVFLEIHYKSSGTLGVGLVSHIINTGETVYTPYIYLDPTVGVERFPNGWNKIYINLTELVNKATTAESFDLFFDFTGDLDNSEATLLIDNIKLLHPK